MNLFDDYMNSPEFNGNMQQLDEARKELSDLSMLESELSEGLWEAVRQEGIVFPLFHADSESQLYLKKVQLPIVLSTFTVEDSKLMIREWGGPLLNAIPHQIDSILLNGDTSTTDNINDIGMPMLASPTMAMDGLRKAALTAPAINMGNNAPRLTDFRQARYNIDQRYNARADELAWIVDRQKTYAALLGMDAFDALPDLGEERVGQVGFIDGVPVFVSAAMPQTASDGKVSKDWNVVHNRGTALCVYRPAWMIGYSRHVSVDINYSLPLASFVASITFRFAFARTADNGVCALYNIGDGL